MNETEVFLILIHVFVIVYACIRWYKIIRMRKFYNRIINRRIEQFEKLKEMVPDEASLEKSRKFDEEVRNRKNAKNLDDIAKRLVEKIPEEKEYLEESIKFNKELLGHIYFEDFTRNLVKLLEKNEDKVTIRKYCDFIEYMWRYGDHDVVNIFDVTIAEALATYDDEWRKFGKYIPNELIEYINEILIPNNIAMNSSQVLEKNNEQENI